MRIKIIYVLVCVGFLSLLGSCNTYLETSLECAGDNRHEFDVVLDYFKDNSNPLKYEAAKFLIENMPYHMAYYGTEAERYQNAYTIMAKNAQDFRDSVVNKEISVLDCSLLQKVSDIRTIKADYLIKFINKACDTWEKVNWNKDYDKSLFFNYVLPYRMNDELLSDWHEEIDKDFSYIYSPIVYSEKGVQYPAYKHHIANAKVVDAPDALKGKVVRMDRAGASVTYTFHSDIPVQKLVRFRYGTMLVDVEAAVEVNDKAVGTFAVEPVDSKYKFNVSRFGMVLDLQKGDNKITVKYVNKPFSLDYMEVAAYEPYDDKNAIDYSDKYCQIQNAATKNYVSLDTISSKIGEPIALHKYSTKDKTLNLRLNYQGYPSWHICPMDSTNLYMEDYLVNLDTMAIVSKQIAIKVENPDPHYTESTSSYQSKYINHQKWVIIPVGDGLCKIMNKLSGLFWESTIDKATGKEIIVQNYYSGKPTQKWKVTQTEKNPLAQSFFRVGNVMSEALKVTDVTKQFQIIGNRGGISPSIAAVLKCRTGACPDEVAYATSLSRRLGIPVAIDFVLHWGNRTMAHLWTALVLPGGKSTPFYMQYAPGDTTQFTHSPVYVNPKIYRRRYEINRDIVLDFEGEESVPELYKLPKFTDVTDQYLPTTDVTRDIPKEYRGHSVAYICVNDKQGWVPVHYGKISWWGKATFKSMGRNVLYTVGIYENGIMIPVGNPFIVEKNGKIREVIYDRNKRQTMTLYRKYPFFAQFDSFKNRMDLGEFQGSNTKDFSKVSTLFIHKGFTNGCSYDEKLKPSNEKYK